MNAFLKRVVHALGVCTSLCVAVSSQAQVILCERFLPGWPANAYFKAEGLVKIRPDTLRLLGSFGPAVSATAFSVQQGMARVSLNNCDTLSLANARAATPNADRQHDRRPACVTRRGEVLTASTQRTGAVRPGVDSIRLRLTLWGRNGRVRWSRLVAPCQAQQNAEALLEAPDGGFYAAGSTTGDGSLLRLDSLGRLLWCRTYRRVFGFRSPTYSRRGTLIFSVNYQSAPTFPYAAGVFEVSQRGDSLGLHLVQIAGSIGTLSAYNIAVSCEALRPLRNGGLLMTGIADTTVANTVSTPFLARYTSSLQVAWVVTLPRYVRTTFYMAQPFELADGTLLVFVHDTYSVLGGPYWLYRYSATGTLLQRYAFTSLISPPTTNVSARGYLGQVQGIQPLRDSTFVLASAFEDSFQSLTYLAHLRVPGLPRVLDSSFFPLAARPGAALASEALGPPHPHPATETVAFVYALPPGTRNAHLVLTDVLGRTVANLLLDQATGRATLPVQTLPAGIYLVTLRVNGQPLASRKLAVAR